MIVMLSFLHGDGERLILDDVMIDDASIMNDINEDLSDVVIDGAGKSMDINLINPYEYGHYKPIKSTVIDFIGIQIDFRSQVICFISYDSSRTYSYRFEVNEDITRERYNMSINVLFDQVVEV